MDPKITQEILDDLIPSLEALDARSAAVLEFMKHEGMASDDKLAPYLEQATRASNVRWLAVRVRIERLLSAADSAQKQKTEPEEKKPEIAKAETTESNPSGPEAGDNSKSAGLENPENAQAEKKKTEVAGKAPGSKQIANDKAGTSDNKNRGRAEATAEESKSAETGAEQKIA